MKSEPEKPLYLLRAFNEREYAEDFIQRGRMRAGRLQVYKRIEDAKRQDADEGDGRLKIWGNVPVITLNRETGEFLSETNQPGYFNYSVSFINPTYIFCMAGPQVSVEYLAQKYGKFIVRIDEPQAFVEEITQYFAESVIWVKLVKVRYDKDIEVQEPPDNEEGTMLSLAQKSSDFRDDEEYRLVVSMPGGGGDDYIFVELNKKLVYANWL